MLYVHNSYMCVHRTYYVLIFVCLDQKLSVLRLYVLLDLYCCFQYVPRLPVYNKV